MKCPAAICCLRKPGHVAQHKKGLRDRNNPICTLSQNCYGDRQAVQSQEGACKAGMGEGQDKEDDGASRYVVRFFKSLES